MLPDEENSKYYNTDGVTTSFPITFNFTDDDTICAWIRNISTKAQDPLVNPDDFSIDGKNFITVDTWDTGYKLLMMRAEPQEQTLNLEEEGPMPSVLLEARVDKLTMMLQDLREKLKRALLLPETYPGDSLIFPEPTDKHFLEWQSGTLQNTQHVSGTATCTEYIKTLLDDIDASAALTTLGFSAFIKTLLNDADAVTARSTLGIKDGLPIGTVLMYNGTGIANAASRSSKLGDDGGDTIDVSLLRGDWYVCNGNASTPNLQNKFVRSESSSGNTGGEDTHILTEAELAEHTHIQNQHRHKVFYQLIGYSHTTGIGVHNSGYTVDSDYATATNQNTGSGDAHENKPSYYSLIFIIKMS